MTSLFWTPDAVQDRHDIYDYIETDRPAAAYHLDESFSDKASVLTRYSELGRAGRVPGTRELVVHDNYLLIYDVVDDIVRILNVVHVARLWPPEGTQPKPAYRKGPVPVQRNTSLPTNGLR